MNEFDGGESGDNMPGNENGNKVSSGRGFAGMDAEKRREAARKGGENSHGGGRQSSQGNILDE